MALCHVRPSQVLPCMMAWDVTPLRVCTFCGNPSRLYSCNSPLLCRMGAFQAVMHHTVRDRSLGLSHQFASASTCLSGTRRGLVADSHTGQQHCTQLNDQPAGIKM